MEKNMDKKRSSAFQFGNNTSPRYIESLLTRTIDAVDDLREAVQVQMKTLEEGVQALVDALPDFEANGYPLSKLRTQLEEAKERDQIETVKGDVRQYVVKLNSFASSRISILKEKLREEREKLHNLIRQGLPTWLKTVFEPSPLQDLLEKQRRDLASEYQALLDEIRLLHETSLGATRPTYNSNIEELTVTYDALLELTKQSQKLTTRLKSYQDRQDDFDAWRRVSKSAVELNSEVLNAYQVFNHQQFKDEVELLWVTLRTRFEAQPLSFLSSHRTVSKDIVKYTQQIARWLDGRRQDFDEQCLTYQQLLATAHIRTELKIPFDRERPTDSQTALVLLVQASLERYFVLLESKLKNSLQIIRYGIQVQGLALEHVEKQAKEALEGFAPLKTQINPEIIGDVLKFKSNILKPLIDFTEEERRLKSEVQQATQKRPAQGSELKLIESIRDNNTGQEIDLRELIIRLMDQKEGIVKLSALMHDLESLFQKNLVDIRIRLARGEQQ